MSRKAIAILMTAIMLVVSSGISVQSFADADKAAENSGTAASKDDEAAADKDKKAESDTKDTKDKKSTSAKKSKSDKKTTSSKKAKSSKKTNSTNSKSKSKKVSTADKKTKAKSKPKVNSKVEVSDKLELEKEKPESHSETATTIGRIYEADTIEAMKKYAAAGTQGGNEENHKYEPGVASQPDVRLLVKAKILSGKVYDKRFDKNISASELNSVLESLYKYMGGAEGGQSGRIEDRLNAKGKMASPKSVTRAEAVGALLTTVMNSQQPEAWEAIREPFFAFISKSNDDAAAKAAAVATAEAAKAAAKKDDKKKAKAEEQVISISNKITREELFTLILGTVWNFQNDKVKKLAPVPDTPASLNMQGEEFYNRDIYLYWVPVRNASNYIVKIFDKAEAKKPKIELMVNTNYLNITRDTDPSFAAVFGDKDIDYNVSYTITAVSKFGVNSKQSSRMKFTSLKYNNAAERFGATHLTYKDGIEGRKHQATVMVNVWRDVDGARVPVTIPLVVNKALVKDIQLIFGEYFNGYERFPIQAIGAFAVRPKRSEHNYGSAVDINWVENYMVGPGGITAGDFWDPSRSRYSIPQGSELVRAFERHGWYWAGNGWGNTYDYMHFSYQGT